MPEKHLGETFWDHVAEFAKRMKIVLITFVVSIFVILVLPANTDFFALTSNYKPLISVLLDYMRNSVLPPNVKLFATSVSDPITLYVFASVVIAIIITMPVFAYETYKFVNPALYPNERRAIFPFVTIVTALFIAGAFFGYFFLAPAFIQGFFPFYYMVGAELWMSIMDFYNILFFTIVISGAIFTIPAFFVLLTKFNIIHTKMFAKKRKYIYAGLGVIAMLISPGATPQGDLYLFVALAALFEASIFMAKKYERGVNPQNVPVLLKFFSSTHRCKNCNTELDNNLSFCPNCKKSLV